MKYAAVVLAAALPALHSCKKEVGAANPIKVYVGKYESEFRGEIVHTPVGSFGGVEAAFGVMLTREAETDTEITFSLDASAVEAYNAAHGTGYLPLPDDAVEWKNRTLHVARGKTASGDALSMSLGDAAKLKGGNAYLGVLKISDISAGSNCVASSNRGTVMVFVTTSETSIAALPDATVPDGAVELDKTGWAASATNPAGGTMAGAGSLIDNQPGTVFFGNFNPTITIDMGEPRQLDIIGIKNEYYDFVSVEKVTVSVSADGVEWKSLGETSLPQGVECQLLRLYASPCRYVKIAVGGDGAAYLSELLFYKNS